MIGPLIGGVAVGPVAGDVWDGAVEDPAGWVAVPVGGAAIRLRFAPGLVRPGVGWVLPGLGIFPRTVVDPAAREAEVCGEALSDPTPVGAAAPQPAATTTPNSSAEAWITRRVTRR